MGVNLPLIFLMGPTASGKTAIVLELAKKLPLYVISVDSALFYRGFDIGTNKPSIEEQKQVPHQLLDIIDANQNYNAANFIVVATEHIKKARAMKKIPILVGGTLFYFYVLLNGLNNIPNTDLAIRKQLEERGQTVGWHTLHQQLKLFDPLSAETIHPNHKQRLIRALEVYQCSGIPLSQWQNAPTEGIVPDFTFALDVLPRKLLHQKIESRFQKMIDQGFENEVLHLLKNHHPKTPAMNLIGYQQMAAYLAGEIKYDAMYQKSIIATRQLAKRQLTWLRNWKRPLCWLRHLEKYCIDDLVNSIVRIVTHTCHPLPL